jgi:uncharacterized damage-inducible protein DinB
MQTIDMIRDVYTYMEWADSQVWTAVRTLPAAAEDARVRVWLQHIHNVQHLFLQVWQGTTPTPKTLDDFPDLAAIEVWGRQYYPAVNAYLAGTAPADLSRVVVLPWSRMIAKALGISPGETTLGETIFQIANHTTHHRAQISARVRELGGEPPLVDYIAWVWRSRPAPVWEANVSV